MTPIQFLALKSQAQKQRHDTASMRIAKLSKLKTWIANHEDLILTALQNDFAKPNFETKLTEILPVLEEIHFFTKNLAVWMKDQVVPTPKTLLGFHSKIRFENKGVVLIISPWNYPFNLAIVPLIAAISAGNTVVLKPSEMTPSTANIMLQMITECFEKNEVSVELGDKSVTEDLLTHHFDHVFFTGSTTVGRLIANACAARLIPVTLELGGKSPTVIDETADLSLATEKIFWGKFLNRGQTCVAPDYIVIHESKTAEFTSRMEALILEHNVHIEGRIISSAHENRLTQMAVASKSVSTQSVTLLPNVTLDHPAMKEEIFGPLLPLLSYADFADLEKILQHFEKPLSLYIFSRSKRFIDKVLRSFPSGGVGINAVIMQLANPHLPFGGVGASGMGSYHGHFGFLELSHRRSIIEQRRFHFVSRLLYPPYTKQKINLLSLTKFFR